MLGEREFLPVLDPVLFTFLDMIKDNFRMKFEKKVPFSYVCEELIEDKEAIIAK
jgi:hypothetical protein